MRASDIINSLHPLERRVLPFLNKAKSFDELVKLSKLQPVEVMRALQWLQNKGILNLKEDIKKIVSLDKNGQDYVKKGLPEKRFLKAIVTKPQSAEGIMKAAGLNQNEITVCLGMLKRKAAIDIEKKDGQLIIKILPQGKMLLKKDSLEEIFVKSIIKSRPLSSLKPEEKFALDELVKRKGIIKVELIKNRNIELTKDGKTLSAQKIDSQVLDRLTHSMLKTSEWKGKKFRSYDVNINVPARYGGRKQHYRRFLENVRKKFIALGFEEMDGPLVETEFWDMDALFMPQFHSARDIHDAYYIKEPKYAKVDANIVERVKKVHETGYGTDSKGWNYKFDAVRTTRQILRTQGTACSARKLASKDLNIPGKYFGINRCFRYDVIDATHNCDFNQTEGIVIEENLNFSHMKGLLRMFAKEFANTEEIKIVPSYFPFTEPSAELFAKHPELGWIELGGCGILRPEVVKPLLGKEISVLAWGMGIDRLAMFNLGINDIRKLFSYDLEFLRNTKME